MKHRVPAVTFCHWMLSSDILINTALYTALSEGILSIYVTSFRLGSLFGDEQNQVSDNANTPTNLILNHYGNLIILLFSGGNPTKFWESVMSTGKSWRKSRYYSLLINKCFTTCYLLLVRNVMLWIVLSGVWPLIRKDVENWKYRLAKM